MIALKRRNMFAPCLTLALLWGTFCAGKRVFIFPSALLCVFVLFLVVSSRDITKVFCNNIASSGLHCYLTCHNTSLLMIRHGGGCRNGAPCVSLSVCVFALVGDLGHYFGEGALLTVRVHSGPVCGLHVPVDSCTYTFHIIIIVHAITGCITFWHNFKVRMEKKNSSLMNLHEPL